MGGEKMENDASIKHHGVEIIASNGSDGYNSHAVYPHFGDKPEESLLGAHAVYPAFDSAHATYPAFGEDSGGLIGEKAKTDESIEHPAYPTFVVDSSGLIGDEKNGEALLEKIGFEIIAG